MIVQNVKQMGEDPLVVFDGFMYVWIMSLYGYYYMCVSLAHVYPYVLVYVTCMGLYELMFSICIPYYTIFGNTYMNFQCYANGSGPGVCGEQNHAITVL